MCFESLLLRKYQSKVRCQNEEKQQQENEKRYNELDNNQRDLACYETTLK